MTLAMLRDEDIKVGICLPLFCRNHLLVLSKENLKDYVLKIEKMGFDSIWMPDRILVAPPLFNAAVLETIVTLSYITSITNEIKIGSCVMNLPFRQPVILAKELATLDYLSNGRLIVGVGMGWFQREFEMCMIEKRSRGERFEEILKIMKVLWTSEKASYYGKFYKIPPITLYPAVVQKPHPPIWIGAGSAAGVMTALHGVLVERALKRVAKMGDGWIIRSTTTPELARNDVRILKKYLQEEGRSLEKFPIAYFNCFLCSPDKDRTMQNLKEITSLPWEDIEKEYCIGNREEIIKKLKEYVALGANYLIMWPFSDDLEQLDIIRSEIVPALIKR
jgi:probable F420-dependent oxidoreductase